MRTIGQPMSDEQRKPEVLIDGKWVKLPKALALWLKPDAMAQTSMPLNGKSRRNLIKRKPS